MCQARSPTAAGRGVEASGRGAIGIHGEGVEEVVAGGAELVRPLPLSVGGDVLGPSAEGVHEEGVEEVETWVAELDCCCCCCCCSCRPAAWALPEEPGPPVVVLARSCARSAQSVARSRERAVANKQLW